MKLIEQGTGLEFNLNKNNYLASGGEGDIYVQGSRAIKVYKDPSKSLKEAKIKELLPLDAPYIVGPKALLVNTKNQAVGYTMPYISDTVALCRLFPLAFRKRHSINEDKILKLVRKLQTGFNFVHSKDILVVDGNELNFLVDDNTKDFENIYFIDVDNFQTKSFPCQAIMPSARDWAVENHRWTKESDWFSFGLLAFNLFVGIHPFKGTYEPFKNLEIADLFEKRIKAKISVLNPNVKVPAAVLPFTVIPPVYLDWFKAIFEEGKRLAPPKDLVSAVTAVKVPVTVLNKAIKIISTFNTPNRIYGVFGQDVLTSRGRELLFGNSVTNLPFDYPPDSIVVSSPVYNYRLLIFKKSGYLKIYNLSAGQFIDRDSIRCDDFYCYNNNVYIKLGMNVSDVVFVEQSNGNVLVGEKLNLTVMPKSSHVLDGFILQDILGRWHLTITPKQGYSYNIEFKEFTGQPVAGKFENNVLMITSATKTGHYIKYVVKFSTDYANYSVYTLPDESSVNFTVLDNGICVHLRENTDIDIFSNKMGQNKTNTIQDTGLVGAELSHDGVSVLAVYSNRVDKISLN